MTNGYHKTAIFAERTNRVDKRKREDKRKKPESLVGTDQSGFVSYVVNVSLIKQSVDKTQKVLTRRTGRE